MSLTGKSSVDQEGKASLLTTVVDSASIARLIKEGLWVNYKFGRIQMRLRQRGQHSPAELERSPVVSGEASVGEGKEKEGEHDAPSDSPTLCKDGYVRPRKEKPPPSAPSFLTDWPSIRGPSNLVKGSKPSKGKRKGKAEEGES